MADARPRRIRDLVAMKAAGRPIVMLTCYDALFARLLDEAGIDVLLVGDSVQQVLGGHDTTLGATLPQMIYHAQTVRRGAPRVPLVVDLPFNTYQASVEEAIRNAGRVLKETGADSVKLEGGLPMAPTVQALVERGIPVLGHIGLVPQSVHALGGYRIQGREQGAAERLIEEARALEAAGAWGIVLELVTAPVAMQVSAALRIPTIGIGSGAGCDGQVLVLTDMLGLDPRFHPKFLRRYAELAAPVVEAARHYAEDVRAGRYPGPDESFA